MAKEEKTLFKSNFVGFAHRVVPLQNVFHKECCEADTEVLQFLSELQQELVKEMVSGACAFSQHRKSEKVLVEDLLCYLDIYWNLDPLLVTENFYGVSAEYDELSIPVDHLQKQKEMAKSESKKKTQAAASKAEKVSVKKSGRSKRSKSKTAN